MRTRLTAIAVAAIAATILTGCFGEQGPPPPPVATIDLVDVPDSMLPSEPTVTVWDRILPATESRPWVVGGSRAEPGEGGAPTVWTSRDGASWTARSVDDDFEGAFSGALGGSDSLAALGGTAWRAGELSSVLWVSADAETWSPVELPESFASTFRIFEVAVAGETVFGIGRDVAGGARGVRVDGEDAVEFELPDVGDDELLAPGQLLASGETLVLLASPGPEGDPGADVTYVSDDAGESWSGAGEITSSPGWVAGVVAVEGGYVATGGSPRDGSSNATGAGAWFSPDGRSWTAEAVPVAGDGPLFYSGSADAWLGTPHAGPAGVTAVFANNNAAMSGVYTRGAAGRWALSGRTGVNPSNGLGGAAVSADESTTVVLLGGWPYARLGTLAGGAWRDTTVLASREDLANPSTVYPGDERALVTLSTSHFTTNTDLSWANRTTYDLGDVEGAALSLVPWDPERAGELGSIVLGTDSSGAEVLLGSYFVPAASTITVEGWFRPDPDSEWVAVSGFPAGAATSFSQVRRIGDEWIAVGTTRASSAVGDADHGTLWTSTDGVTWSAPGGDFGAGTLESSVVDVCSLPDGTGVAVGWVEEAPSEFRTAVWAGAESGWARVDIGPLGTAGGYATACASDEDGVILAANVSGRDTLQRSTDGGAWDEVFRAERGIALGEPVAVPGGFAASGSLTTASFAGPVAWLSADGLEWSPVAIPSHDSGSTLDVAPYGDDLLVTMNARVGHPVAIIRDIEAAIAAYAG